MLDPRSCDKVDDTTWFAKGIRTLRSTELRCVARGWSRIEIRMRSDSTACGASPLVMRLGSNGKRRSATKSLVRLCVANATCTVRSGANHLSHCCLGYAFIELTIFYSVNTGDFTSDFHEMGNQGRGLRMWRSVLYK